MLALVSFAGRSARAEGANTLLTARNDAYDCTFAEDGTLIAATHGGLWIGDALVTALDGLPDTRVDRVRVERDSAIAETRSGTARVSLTTRRVSDVKKAIATNTAPIAPEFFRGGIVRRRGAVRGETCVATSRGIYRGPTGGSLTLVAPFGPALPSGDISALAPTEKELFVGTFDQGLFRWSAAGVEPFADPAINPNINALAWDAVRNTLWIATARGLTHCSTLPERRCTRVGGNAGVHAIMLLKNGELVAGGDNGLTFLSATGDVQSSVTQKQGAPFRAVWSLAASPDGTLFVGTARGVYWANEFTFRNFTASALHRASMVTGDLADDWVTALATRGSELVVGTYNAGIASFERTGDTLQKSVADLSLGYVNFGGLTVLPNGELAVATMNGLHVGRMGSFRRVPTLGVDTTAVAVNAQHQGKTKWVASRRGISRF